MALDKLTLNGTELNDETNYVIEAIDFTPPAKRPEWAPGADSDGSLLVRTPLYDNRTVAMTLRVKPQASQNAALEKVGAIVDLLQEAEKNPGGIPLEWTPANATKKVTLYVLTGAITAIPMVNDGSTAGFYVNAPQLNISLTCKPFGYGTEETALAAKSIETGLSVVVGTITTALGDVPAEGRLIVKDTATIGRRFVEWGIQNRYYDAATALILDNESMTAVGGTGKATLTGAYKPGAGNAVISTTLVQTPTICANTGVLKHVGTFRVKARVQATMGGSASPVSNVHVRLSYQDGEGPFRANEWVAPVLGGKLVEVDLGVITTTTATLGTQKWLGQVEAYSDNLAASDKLELDYLVFIPILEGYGKARGVQSSAPGSGAAFDNFTTGTLSGNLNARTPAVGAAWATSGVATDWTVKAAVDGYGIERKTSAEASRRLGVLGAALTNSAVIVAGAVTTTVASGSALSVGPIVRFVDGSNYAFLQWKLIPVVSVDAIPVSIQLVVVVAGVETELAFTEAGANGGVPFLLSATLSATTDGALTATGKVATQSFSMAAQHSSLATGGALASGKGGVHDKNGNAAAITRSFSSVAVQQIAGPPYCVQPSRTMEAQSDETIAQDSTGTYYGPVPQYRGSRFYVPQDGSANRTSRIIVKADRNDLEANDQQTIADAFTAEVKITPRYLAIPR